MRPRVSHNNGHAGVIINECRHGIDMDVTIDGSTWEVIEVNDTLLMVMQGAIAKFMSSKDNKEKTR